MRWKAESTPVASSADVYISQEEEWDENKKRRGEREANKKTTAKERFRYVIKVCGTYEFRTRCDSYLSKSYRSVAREADKVRASKVIYRNGSGRDTIS